MSLGARKKRGRPPLLTHDRVLNTTIELLAEVPVESFTMQRVSERLNVAPMTLYGYYPSRDTLLQAVAEKLFLGLDLHSVDEADTWPEKIHAWCHCIREQLHSLPNLFRLITDPSQLTAAWLEASRPLVDALAHAGLDREQSAFFTRWIGRTVVGTLIVESSFDKDVFRSITQHTQAIVDQLSPRAAAHLEAMSPHVMQQDDDLHFELTISTIIHALEAALLPGHSA